MRRKNLCTPVYCALRTKLNLFDRLTAFGLNLKFKKDKTKSKMVKRTKNILVFMFCAVFAAGLYIWFYPLDYGHITAHGNVEGFSMNIRGDITDCTADICSVNVKTGVQIIDFQKDGYVSDRKAVQVTRFNTTDISFSLIKIPSLTKSDFIPAEEQKPEKSLPTNINTSLIISPVWNADKSKLAYVDLNDDRLKIYESGQAKTVASLKNLSKNFGLLWSPDGKYLFGSEGNGIYFINTDKASRKKEVLGFSPQYFKWAGDDALLANDDSGSLYIINMVSETISPLSVKFDLSKSVYGKDGNPVSFSYDKTNKQMSVESFDVNAVEKKTLLSKYDFQPGDIRADVEKNIYIYNSSDSTWYSLDY